MSKTKEIPAMQTAFNIGGHPVFAERLSRMQGTVHMLRVFVHIGGEEYSYAETIPPPAPDWSEAVDAEPVIVEAIIARGVADLRRQIREIREKV